MKWPIIINWPESKWAGLAFADKTKLLALRFQAGAGMAMTAYAGYALYQLAVNKAVWPIFYLGAIALVIVAIVVTGFGALLYKRNTEFEAFGIKFKAQDQEGAAVMAQQVKEISSAQPIQRPDLEGIRGIVDSALAGAGMAQDQQRPGNKPPQGTADGGQRDSSRPEG